MSIPKGVSAGILLLAVFFLTLLAMILLHIRGFYIYFVIPSIVSFLAVLLVYGPHTAGICFRFPRHICVERSKDT
ncbi:MAG: hypothetical protein H0Z28_12290 [Archaeoglobus sp.]|nr:hypothetical protein [Archaeoglobus sp.]